MNYKIILVGDSVSWQLNDIKSFINDYRGHADLIKGGKHFSNFKIEANLIGGYVHRVIERFNFINKINAIKDYDCVFEVTVCPYYVKKHLNEFNGLDLGHILGKNIMGIALNEMRLVQKFGA